MNKQLRRAALNAAGNLVASKGRTASLRSAVAFASDGVTVDEAAGVIRGAAVMVIGPAAGHGFSIDATTLQQVEALGNAAQGPIRVRFKHPMVDENGQPADDLGTVIGYVDGLRVVGDTLRGDVHIEDYAEVMPGLGNVKDYLIRRAKQRPETFGLSAVIYFDAEPVTDAAGNVVDLVARVTALDAIDVVGKGAATPNGLLTAKGCAYEVQVADRTVSYTAATPEEVAKLKSLCSTPAASVSPAAPVPQVINKSAAAPAARLSKGKLMDPKVKQYLQANHALAADASDEDAQTMFDGLSADEQAKASAPLADKTPAATQLRGKAIVDAGDEFLALEGKRVAQLQQLGNTLNVDKAVVQLAIAEGDDVMKGRTRFLKALQETAKPVTGAVRVGADANAVSMRASLSDAIRLRAGCKVEKPHDRAAQLRGLPLIDMGRQYLAAHGIQEAFGMTQVDVWKALFAPRSYSGDNTYRFAQLAQSSDSFTNITLDAANKSLRQAYLDGQATWTAWARRATAPDFKNINRIALSDSPGLSSRSEGGPINYVVMSDSKETYVLTEYTGGIRLTRQAIINDDLDAFGRIPQLQGAAARRKEDDVCYTVVTANAAMADTGLLFNSTAVTTAGGHANYTSSGTAISVTSLGVGRKTMRVQTGPKGAYLNLMPRFMLVPAALEALADQYTSSQFVPAISSSVNPFMQGGKTPLTPIIEPRLDANSATAWYLAASNDQIDTIEVCFLQDEPEPVLKQEVDFDTDDVKFAVRHTVAAKAIDFRGLYKNAGA